MMDPVEDIFARLQDISLMLKERSEPSLETTLDDVHRKTLLLTAASYFESRLLSDVEDFCSHALGEQTVLVHIIKTRFIARQYHTWFDWDVVNANKFFGQFGPQFKAWMALKIKAEGELADQIKDFMLIGSDRNRLVHQNFGQFSLESTASEIRVRYQNARKFVDRFKTFLHDFLEEFGGKKQSDLI